MKPGNINSHIQMPRFLLRRFENEQHRFFYYDIVKRFIGTNGHAKTMNTEYGYYPDEMETLLDNEIEQPFSQILTKLDTVDFEKPTFTLNSREKNIIKLFFMSLIVRSPVFLDSINKNSIFFQFYNSSDQKAIAILYGLEESDRQKILDDYHVTLTVNKTSKPFILPISGVYSYKINGYTCFSLPVSPKIAITLFETAGIHLIEMDNIIRLFLINIEEYIVELNGLAFRRQCSQNYGYVISPSRNTLVELLPVSEL